MRFLTFLSLMLFYKALFAQQFALIQDKEGFVNVRDNKAISGKIVGTLKTGTVAFAFEPEGEWCFVSYREGNNPRESFGYIHQSRMKPVSSFENIPLTKRTNKEVLLSKDSIEVRIVAQAFDSLLHTITYSKERFITAIDGKEFWGTDGGMPRYIYRSIDIRVGRKTISLKKSIQDLYEPNLKDTKCYYDTTGDVLYLTAMNSDGAGSYVVVWIIEKGKYRERLVVRPF